jgi:hypothetical protein
MQVEFAEWVRLLEPANWSRRDDHKILIIHITQARVVISIFGNLS